MDRLLRLLSQLFLRRRDVFPFSNSFVPEFASRGTPFWLFIRWAFLSGQLPLTVGVATARLRFWLDDLMSGEEFDKDVATQAGKRSDAIQEGSCGRLGVGKEGDNTFPFSSSLSSAVALVSPSPSSSPSSSSFHSPSISSQDFPAGGRPRGFVYGGPFSVGNFCLLALLPVGDLGLTT